MADQSHVGRKYSASDQVVTAQAVADYAKAIAGSAEVFSPGEVPSVYSSVYCLYPTSIQLLGDQDLQINLMGLVHGEQSFEYPAPVHVGDVLDSTATLVSVDEKAGKTFLGVDFETKRQSDSAVVCRGHSTLVIRGTE